MIVKSKITTNELTKDKLYLVLGIYEDDKRWYEIIDNNFINDSNLIDGNYHVGYISISKYLDDNFEMVDNNIPYNWITREKRTFFNKKVKYTSFNFFIENEVFFARLIDGSEPERSIFYYELNDLYKKHGLGNIVPNFNLIDKAHLADIVYPRTVLEDWVDPVDGKLYKSNN